MKESMSACVLAVRPDKVRATVVQWSLRPVVVKSKVVYDKRGVKEK